MCKYCERNEQDELTPIPRHKYDEYGESFLIAYSDGLLDLWVIKDGELISTEEFQIKYCPMCGKALDK